MLNYWSVKNVRKYFTLLADQAQKRSPCILLTFFKVGVANHDSFDNDLLHLRGIPVRRLLSDDPDVRVERRLLALLPAFGQRIAREATEERDVAGLDLVFMT